MRKFKVIFLFLLLLLFCAGVAFVISPFMNVREIKENHINAPIDTEIFAGLYDRNWLFTSEENFEQIILENNLVESAKVKKTSIWKLEITITWKTPFVAFVSGAFYVITDDKGIVLEVSQLPNAPYVIDGFRVKNSIVGKPIDSERVDLVESAVKLVYIFSEYAKKNEEFDLTPDIVLIDGNLIQRINSKFCINFGTGYDPEEQFVSAASIYMDMKKKQINSGVINLSNPNQQIYEPWKEQF